MKIVYKEAIPTILVSLMVLLLLFLVAQTQAQITAKPGIFNVSIHKPDYKKWEIYVNGNYEYIGQFFELSILEKEAFEVDFRYKRYFDFDIDADGYSMNIGDCYDNDSNINLAIPEYCNGIDDDCDGEIDEGEGIQGCNVFYKDADNDGYGENTDSRCLCKPDETGKYTAYMPGDPNDSDPTQVGFNFKGVLFGDYSTISLKVESINKNTGEVNINGLDTQQPTNPFTWNWGDGTTTIGYFRQKHTYSDLTKNYIVKVTAHYQGGNSGFSEILVYFNSFIIDKIILPSDISVTIPDSYPSITSRNDIPSNLTYFDDTFFNIIPRSTIEYILTVAASIQMDFVNNNVYLINGGFNQIILRNPSPEPEDKKKIYSLCYTTPVSIVGGDDYGFQGSIEWSSFFQEMGHNFTLNSPSDYYYCGRTDGNANAIFSESVANISNSNFKIF